MIKRQPVPSQDNPGKTPMTRLILLATAGLIVGATAQPAAAFGISQASFTVPANGSMPACLQRAREILEQTGLRVLSTGSASVGAEPQDGSVLVTAFCLPNANTVVMTAAGTNTTDTGPVLERLRSTMQTPPPANRLPSK